MTEKRDIEREEGGKEKNEGEKREREKERERGRGDESSSLPSAVCCALI
jgi:hypothetical protein